MYRRCAGSPHILVSGPPGAGKTTFLERLLESCPTRMLAVVRFESTDAHHHHRGDPFEWADAVLYEGEGHLPLPVGVRVFVMRPLPGGARLCRKARVEVDRISDPDVIRSITGLPFEEGQEILIEQERWALAKGYEALAGANLALVNIHSQDERPAAEETIRRIEAMGSEESVASDVFAGRPAHDRRLTIRIANLADRRDKELRKAIATAERNFPYRRM